MESLLIKYLNDIYIISNQYYIMIDSMNNPNFIMHSSIFNKENEILLNINGNFKKMIYYTDNTFENFSTVYNFYKTSLNYMFDYFNKLFMLRFNEIFRIPTKNSLKEYLEQNGCNKCLRLKHLLLIFQLFNFKMNKIKNIITSNNFNNNAINLYDMKIFFDRYEKYVFLNTSYDYYHNELNRFIQLKTMYLNVMYNRNVSELFNFYNYVFNEYFFPEIYGIFDFIHINFNI